MRRVRGGFVVASGFILALTLALSCATCGRHVAGADGGEGRDSAKLDAESDSMGAVIESSDMEADSSDRDAPLDPDQQLCRDDCATVANIQCGDRQGPVLCELRCLDALSSRDRCANEARVVIKCFIASGPGAFECNVTAGATVLKAGFCQQEQTDFNNCMDHPG